jgi:hypothetical protein
VKRWLFAIVLLACSKKADPPAPPAAPSVDPFDPMVECNAYATRAKTHLTNALVEANSNDMTDAKALRARAATLGKARDALGREPAFDKANAHYKRAKKSLDQLIAGFTGIASSREEGGAVTPEVQKLATMVLEERKNLQTIVGDVAGMCAP